MYFTSIYNSIHSWTLSMLQSNGVYLSRTLLVYGTSYPRYSIRNTRDNCSISLHEAIEQIESHNATRYFLLKLKTDNQLKQIKINFVTEKCKT